MPRLFHSLIFCLIVISFFVSAIVRADEGGVSFWIPGQSGSFAATLQDPGWNLPIIYYHTSASSKKSVFVYGKNITAGVDATGDMFFVSPTYVFKDPLWKGQAALTLTAAVGQIDAGADASLSYPGNAFTGHRNDLGSGASDLYPMGSVRWRDADDNYMVYTTFNIPVGSYDSDKIANMGLGHWAWDAGGAYTYYDEKDGQEISATLGFTYNFKNTHTDYQSGVDTHFDFAGAQFINPKFLIGLVGYYYYQLSPDSGSGAIVSHVSSEVAGLGPQFGYFFKQGNDKWYTNLKSYYEFSNFDRPAGWNLWWSLMIPL